MKQFSPLAGRSLLSEKVLKQIEEAIRLKKLLPGTRLPSETELCNQFGVSRSVIREALRVLNSRGLITILKGKGMYISEYSSQHASDPLHFYLQLNFERSYIMDIIHARQILEPPIAELAAKNRSAEDLERLSSDLEHLRSSSDDFKDLAKTDMQFHIDIAKASGNSLMPLLLEPIHHLMPEIKLTIYETVGDAKKSAVIWHQKIFDAIRAGTDVEARTAMVEHLKIAEDHVERMLKARMSKKDDGASESQIASGQSKRLK